MQAAGDRKTTVFVSYRRDSGFVLAKYIFDYLNAAGYDVFMDVHSLGAGEFEQTTLAEVAARDYFLLVLTSGSLQRMIRENDWLRKELMRAIESGRMVVPVLAEGFKFEDRRVQEVLQKLPPALQALPSFNAVLIPPPEYFDSAMNRLRTFLKATAVPALSHGTDQSSGTTAKSSGTTASKGVARAQSALHGLTLPPVASLAKIQSATPWSDLQAMFAGTGAVGAGAPAPKKPAVPPRLRAPALKGEVFGLTWTEVSRAEKYVLEEGGDAEFKSPGTVVYQGPKTSWMDLSAISLRTASFFDTLMSPSKYYRVKAVGKGAVGESGWSNVVKIVTAPPVAPPRLRAPALKKAAYGLTWTEVSRAEKYVLEESGDAEFKSPGTVVYEGPKTSWMNLPADLLGKPKFTFVLPAPAKYYRVKAVGKGAAGESGWSNIVGAPRSR